MFTFYQKFQYEKISPFFSKGDNILDFGCGDMGLMNLITKLRQDLNIVGVDINSPKSIKRTNFILYDGKRLPFKDNCFDLVYVYHVLHHLNNLKCLLSEIFRVTKKKVLIIEPIIRFYWEKPFMKIVDMIANSRRKEKINLPFSFLTEEQLIRLAKQEKGGLCKIQNASFFPGILPIGKTKLYLFEKYNVFS